MTEKFNTEKAWNDSPASANYGADELYRHGFEDALDWLAEEIECPKCKDWCKITPQLPCVFCNNGRVISRVKLYIEEENIPFCSDDEHVWDFHSWTFSNSEPEKRIPVYKCVKCPLRQISLEAKNSGLISREKKDET